jgi:membrane protein DedA with SNARE-associated domain
MLESLTDLVSSSPWTYAVIFAVAALDAVLPIVPSESTLIAAGVVAGVGGLHLAAVILLGAAGAFVGDNAGYGLGRALDDRVRRLLFTGARGRKRLEFVEGAFERRGGSMILVGRFIPGGRTAVTFTAGATAYLYARFVVFAIIAALTWSTYATLLGYAGGKAYENEPLKALLFGFGIAIIGAALIEASRRWGGRLVRAAR